MNMKIGKKINRISCFLLIVLIIESLIMFSFVFRFIETEEEIEIIGF